MQINQGLYIGQDNEESYIGYIATDNIFLIIAVEDGFTKENGEKLIDTLKIRLAELSPVNLSSFEGVIGETILKFNIPLSFSLAAGYVSQDILYLKTAGEGEIFLRRGKDFVRLLSGDNRASGYIREYDCIIFSTKKIRALLGEVEEIKKLIGYKRPSDIANDLYSQELEETNGSIALFIEFTKKPADREITAMETPLPEGQISMSAPVISSPLGEGAPYRANWIKNVFAKLPFSGRGSKNPLLLGGVVIVFIILVWSVVFGHKRRVEAQLQAKIAHSREIIDKKLGEADQEAILNVSKAEGLIADAKNEAQKLQREIGKQKPQEVKIIMQVIQDQEDKIMKKEEKNYSEFYDLALENKDAQGNKMFLDQDVVAILDRKNTQVYVLSLAKKSIVSYKAGELKEATIVLLSKDKVYFYVPSKGVYEFTDIAKVTKIIDQDSDWGKIIDGAMYGSNFYFLDQGKDEIYKYVPVEKGYSSKTSYFQSGQAINLAGATSLAIDSAIYVSLGDQIYRFTRGVDDRITTAFPDKDAVITKVYTNADFEKLAAWDKKKGTVYILSKDGVYERQIKSGIFTQADDITIFEGVIYVLVGQKIDKIDL